MQTAPVSTELGASGNRCPVPRGTAPSHIQLFLISRGQQPAEGHVAPGGERLCKIATYSLDQLPTKTAGTLSDGPHTLPFRQCHLRTHFRVFQVGYLWDKYKCYPSYNTDEVRMAWAPTGVSKMREKMELADYELENITSLRTTEVTILFYSISYFLAVPCWLLAWVNDEIPF